MTQNFHSEKMTKNKCIAVFFCGQQSLSQKGSKEKTVGQITQHLRNVKDLSI
jgi:IS30 family transposase